MKQGRAFWLTGLPGSGKTTLAMAAKAAVPRLVVLQMDEMRRVVTPEPTYSGPERDHLYRGIVYSAMVVTREGHDVVIDATANLRVWRELARAHIPGFHEIYVKCPLDVCRAREAARVDTLAPKGIYKKALEGWPVPGVNAPYEEPLKPEMVIDCAEMAADEAAGKLIEYIKGVFS
jgi:adenylylsulfate kinase